MSRSEFCTILLHLLLSRASPASKTDLFISYVMLSIYRILALLFARVPLTSIFIVCFILLSSSICKMCPLQHNLACLAFTVMFSTPKSLLIVSLLSLSLSLRVAPLICLHNLISVVSKSLSSFRLSAKLLLHTAARE